jgi:hypothetical protein
MPSQSAVWGWFRFGPQAAVLENTFENHMNPVLVLRGLAEWPALANSRRPAVAVAAPPENLLRAEWAAAGLLAGLRAGNEWA